MVGCVTSVEQVVNGKIRNGKKNERKTPSAENENNSIEVAETSGSANR